VIMNDNNALSDNAGTKSFDYDNILLEQVEAGIYRLIINRPKSLNALNAQTVDELYAAIQAVGRDRRRGCCY
jgi:enoyl-CoA hydratase/carnithine racemase